MTTVPFAAGAGTHQPRRSTPSAERNARSSKASWKEAGVRPPFSRSGNWKRRVVPMPARKYGTQPNAKRRKPSAAVTATRLSQTFFLMRSLPPPVVDRPIIMDRTQEKAGERPARHDGPRLRVSLGAFDRPGRAVTTSAA